MALVAENLAAALITFFPVLGIVSVIPLRVARGDDTVACLCTLPIILRPGHWLKDGAILWWSNLIPMTPYLLVSVTGVGGVGELVSDVGTG